MSEGHPKDCGCEYCKNGERIRREILATIPPWRAPAAATGTAAWPPGAPAPEQATAPCGCWYHAEDGIPCPHGAAPASPPVPATRTLYLPDGWDKGLHVSPCCRPEWRQEGESVICHGCQTRVTLTLSGSTAAAMVERDGTTSDRRRGIPVREIRIIPQPAAAPVPATDPTTWGKLTVRLHGSADAPVPDAPATVLGMTVKVDPSMPPDEVSFQDKHGNEVGRIVGLAAPVPDAALPDAIREALDALVVLARDIPHDEPEFSAAREAVESAHRAEVERAFAALRVQNDLAIERLNRALDAERALAEMTRQRDELRARLEERTP